MLALGIALSALDATIVNLALPAITRDLHASAADAVWVVNAYQLAALAVLLPCAAIGDRIGYRTVYLLGTVLLTAASLMCFFATSLFALVLARGVQGLGAAGIMAVNGALVRLIYPRHLMGRGIAVNTVVVATSAVAGPSVAAAVMSFASWPWLFAPNIPLGGLVLLLGWRALPRNKPAPAGASRLSVLDVVLNVAMFGLIFLGVQELGVHAGTPGATGTPLAGPVLLVVGCALGFVYLRRQWRQVAPLFPLDLLRIPVFALSMCTSVASFAAQTLAFVALPFLMLETWGHNTLEAGLLITAWPLALIVVAPLAGRLIGRYADGLLGGLGLAALALGLALLAVLPAAPAFAGIAWRMALCGAGFGLFQSPNNHTILTIAPVDRMGAAGGMLGTARLTGQTLGAVILAFIFSVAGAHDGRGPLLALALAAGFAGSASVFSLLRLRHPAV